MIIESLAEDIDVNKKLRNDNQIPTILDEIYWRSMDSIMRKTTMGLDIPDDAIFDNGTSLFYDDI